MPLYEFECRKCGEVFDRIISLSEREKGEVSCPKCESPDVKQVLGGGTYSIQVGLKGYRGKVR
ncbi:MAG: zinc ribbon domain-containing protein [bacterium]|nr:MAG: zinc ribbon domain-containing protein [bacterium]